MQLYIPFPGICVGQTAACARGSHFSGIQARCCVLADGERERVATERPVIDRILCA